MAATTRGCSSEAMKLEAVALGSFWALLGFLLNPGAVLNDPDKACEVPRNEGLRFRSISKLSVLIM
jgi:hypothetical protein